MRPDRRQDARRLIEPAHVREDVREPEPREERAVFGETADEHLDVGEVRADERAEMVAEHDV